MKWPGLFFLFVGFCGIALAASAQPIEKVPAKDAWLYAHNGFQMPRKVPKENFDKVRYGMTLEDMVKLLGKAWMRPNSSIRDIYWGCEDGRVIRVDPKTYCKDERVIQGTGDELTPGATIQMYREKNGKYEILPIPVKGEEKEDKKAGASNEPKGKRDDIWQRPSYKAQEPRKLKAELFDKVRSGMTMGELVDLLGPIWIPSLGASNFLLWRCEDGRELRADPISALKDEVLRVDGGRGGIGKMWMMRLKEGRLEEVRIPSLADQAAKAEAKQSPILKLKTIHPAHKSQPTVQQFDFEGIGGGPMHRSGPEHFKLTRVDNGKVVGLSVAYDRSELNREGCPRDKVENRPANSMTRHAYNSFFKGVRFHLENGNYEAKDVAVEQGILDLFGRANLEPGVRYRLTWACWPVGAAKATEVSSDFELTNRGKRPEKGREDDLFNPTDE